MPWLNRWVRILIVSSLGWGGAQVAVADKLLLASDPWCPMICIDNAHGPGYVVEAVRLALAPHGYEVEYVNLPWSRALRSALDGEVDGLLSASVGEEQALVYSEHAYFLAVAGYALHKRRAPLKDLSEESLAGLRFLLIQDYDYSVTPVGGWLKSHGEDVDYVKGDNALPRILNMIVRGRADIVVDDYEALRYNIGKLRFEGYFHVVPISKPVRFYITMSRRVPNAARVAGLLDQEFKAMREDGRLVELARKYGVYSREL